MRLRPNQRRPDFLLQPARHLYGGCGGADCMNGYAKEVLNKLPMEFAVEAQKL